MFFEVFVLAIVNELYFSALSNASVIEEGQRRLDEKVELLHQYAVKQEKYDNNTPPFIVADFGTRRRFSKVWQAHVVETLHNAEPKIVSGTSNVYLAKKLGMTPIGTMAHEFMQAFQALDVRLRDSQKAALEAWVHEYRDRKEHTSELQSRFDLVCRLLLEKKKQRLSSSISYCSMDDGCF